MCEEWQRCSSLYVSSGATSTLPANSCGPCSSRTLGMHVMGPIKRRPCWRYCACVGHAASVGQLEVLRRA